MIIIMDTAGASEVRAESELYVMVCDGHRCGALLRSPDGDALQELRQAVRTSRRTVLISTGCLGGCSEGPLVAVASGQRVGRQVQAQGMWWLGPMDRDRLGVLAGWVEDGGPEVTPLPPELDALRRQPVATTAD